MDDEITAKVSLQARAEIWAEFDHKIGKLAHLAYKNGASLETIATICEDRLGWNSPRTNSKGQQIQHVSVTRSLGRMLTGANSVTSGLVLVDGKLTLKTKTGFSRKLHEYKIRRHDRAQIATMRAAILADLHTVYVAKSGPYRRGGAQYRASYGKASKDLLRAVVHRSDQLAAKGDYRAALANLLGDRN